MEKDELREIIREFYDSPLSLLEIEDGSTRVKMEKPVASGTSQIAYPVLAPAPAAAPAAAVVPASMASAAAPAAAGSAAAETARDERMVEVTAPLVGVYYSAATPQDPPYVEEGSHVEEGEVVCLIEAMKMFNEIKAPASGTVRKIMRKTEDAVGFDDVLMLIEADE